jgi:hypothetical protein
MRSHQAYGPVAALSAAERAILADHLRELRDKRKRLDRLGHYWLRGPVAEALGGRQARWQALFDHSWDLISSIDSLLDSLGSRLVSVPKDCDASIVRADAGAVVQHFSGGGKSTAFGFFTPKALKDRSYLRDEITVDGQPADSQERLQVVCDHLDLVLAFRALELAWLDANGLPSAPQFRIRVAAIKEHVAGLD